MLQVKEIAMIDLASLKRNLKKDIKQFPVVRVALLGDSATQLVCTAIRGYGVQEGFNFEVYEADYDQIDTELLNENSELYTFHPDILLLFYSSEKLIQKFYHLPKSMRGNFAVDFIDNLNQSITAISSKIKCSVICSNLVEMNDAVFGNYSNKVESSFLFQIRKINFELMNIASRYGNFFINDISSLQNRFGRNFIFSPAMYANAGMVHSIDFLPHLAKNVVDIIKAIKGRINKCLVLDLDNTLWGGIIGDDGMEGIQIGNLGIGEVFTKLQLWAKELKERGIILAICSKNEEKAAKEPFLSHPDMVLRMEDISVFVANWENKADNIRHIQSILNIGFDSFVFVDDNPVERKIVRDNLPEIEVPELPEDPAEYLPFLQSLNLFETASVSENDSDRTQQYQEEAKRMNRKNSFVNEDEFLKSLEMNSKVGAFEKMEIPRIAQLSQRSNQFNLRTVRLTDEDVKLISESKKYVTRYFKLADAYGDYGLVSILILEKTKSDQLFIHSWLMSCRVLKRGLENVVLNEIVSLAKANNCLWIVGEYLPTAKNEMVKNHYTNLGFDTSTIENQWVLSVEKYQQRPHFISIN